jgi:4-amino-4-deoxy-L-arabinose transferase-like glycosyltransferase
LRESGTLTKRPLLKEPSLYRRRLLLLILALTFVRGLLYLAVFPPWQHYDEPTHFEYLRLIAERARLPHQDDYDLAMRQEIASSMQAAGFWKGLQAPTIEFWSDEPPPIGVSELGHPPLYYALQALPQLLVAHQDVETQLYLARFITVLLSLIVVTAAYGLLVEVFPQWIWLPVAVAAFIALLPPFADLMSAVNNDTGAVAAVSLLLWSSARLARRGPSPGRLVIVLLLTGACIATKSTAGVVAVTALLALGVGYVPRVHRRWVWCGLILLILFALLAVLSWGGQAAHWPSETEAAAPNRVQTRSFLGNAAFSLSAEGSRHPRGMFQELNSREGGSLAGHTVTVGAWIRAPEGSEGPLTLSLQDGLTVKQHEVEVTTDWQFYAFTTTVSVDAPGVAIHALLPYREDPAQEVYLDGLVLVDGEMPTGIPPQFDTIQARTAQWGPHRVVNLLLNGSAEKVWPGLRPWIGNQQMYRTPISLVLLSLWDLPRTGWVYGPESSILLQSFWARFGWNHLTVAPAYFYPLGFLTVLGLVGGAIWLVRLLKSHHNIEPWQWGTWAMMAMSMIIAWGAAILRVHPVFIIGHFYWPVARYAAVAIVPTCTLLCLGLAEIVPRRWLRPAAWLGLLGIIALDTIAIWTVILPYYYG